MRISLVLATFGRCDDVGRFLQSLADQSDSDFEVLIVDQNADDRLVPWVKQYVAAGLHINHIRMDKPSLSGARNLGIERSNGEIIGFPDDDCWYETNTIAEVRKAFASPPPKDGLVINWVEQTTARKTDAGVENLSNKAWRNFRGGDASSISLFFTRKLLVSLNGFDVRMGVGQWFGAGEETDLVLRALATGAAIQRAPLARVHHLYGAQASGTASQRNERIRIRARGTGAIYAKHRLSIFTVARGLLAPVVKPIAKPTNWAAVTSGVSIAIGRFEGALRWGWGKP